MRYTHEFQSFSMRISDAIRSASKMLAKHSIPYWSPRYGAHMCSDLSMPALLGYFMAMLYNPNNITPEVSPLTTAVEAEVGSQFCRLFGYNVGNGNDGKVPGWGHVTCDGTVANIEAMWVARNLKYYPLTLWLAITESDLGFIADRVLVRTCIGEEKLFKDLDTWELLNLRPETILDLPAMLHRTFGISARFLGSVLARYSVQKVGKEVLDRIFGIENQMQFLLGKMSHYSWEKGGGVLGIGSNNLMAACWATLTSSTDSFICVPFNEVPIGRDSIQRDILDRSYDGIVKDKAAEQQDHQTIPLLRNLGSDLNINAFALNWRYSDGTLNTDIEEANDLMRRVVKMLSIDSPNADPAKVPLIAHHSLSRNNHDPIYPDEMPFYLYGSPLEWHISHIMVRAPNVVLDASNIHLTLDNNTRLPSAEIRRTLILTFADIHEASRHPFQESNAELGPSFFFRSGERFRVNLWKNPGQWREEHGGVSLMERLRGTRGAKVATGWVQLGENVFVDVEDVNRDEDGIKPCYDGDGRDWLDEFELMGKN
ncbi:hypothetical protein N8T08_010816 [Aspergillus melleus]|uniref:Uncharacterized protein n=1 Tax=Aspergillus melleus TaxID=138277 RepID=A0ACC3BCE8_9EURO|nr:hypothetical protein N8T08_010816 [Aspergillus melleus]